MIWWVVVSLCAGMKISIGRGDCAQLGPCGRDFQQIIVAFCQSTGHQEHDSSFIVRAKQGAQCDGTLVYPAQKAIGIGRDVFRSRTRTCGLARMRSEASCVKQSASTHDATLIGISAEPANQLSTILLLTLRH